MEKETSRSEPCNLNLTTLQSLANPRFLNSLSFSLAVKNILYRSVLLTRIADIPLLYIWISSFLISLNTFPFFALFLFFTSLYLFSNLSLYFFFPWNFGKLFPFITFTFMILSTTIHVKLLFLIAKSTNSESVMINCEHAISFHIEVLRGKYRQWGTQFGNI